MFNVKCSLRFTILVVIVFQIWTKPRQGLWNGASVNYECGLPHEDGNASSELLYFPLVITHKHLTVRVCLQISEAYSCLKDGMLLFTLITSLQFPFSVGTYFDIWFVNGIVMICAPCGLQAEDLGGGWKVTLLSHTHTASSVFCSWWDNEMRCIMKCSTCDEVWCSKGIRKIN
jgi:hypothetical protein